MQNHSSVTVGVLSDTHLPHRLATLPPQIVDIFRGVDVILHAGDVDDIAQLRPLRHLAPLYAVRGNVHLTDRSWGGKDLPWEVRLTLARRRVVLTHGHRPGLMGWLFKALDVIRSTLSAEGDDLLNEEIVRRLHRRYPHADVVIFGHSHAVYCRTIGRTLFFNPGSVVPSRKGWASVGILRLSPDRIEPEVIRL